MQIDLPAIEAFLAVADGGSTHAAARALGLSQAAVSRRIGRLESLVGTALFRRTGHSLMLSPGGELFLPLARQHVSGLRTAMTELRMTGSGHSSTVSIACLATLALFALPQIVADLTQSRPSLRLRILDMTPGRIEGAVEDGTADFAVTMLGVGASDLVHEVVLDQPLVLAVGVNHPMAERGEVTWRELEGVRLIGMGPGSAHYQLLESVRPQIRHQWEEFHQVQRITTALAMVAAGTDAALVPLNLALSRPFGVRTIRVIDPVVSRRIGILRRAGHRLSPEADFVRRLIKARLRDEAGLGALPSSI